MVEGIAHLERIANMKEPEEPKIKAHYYDGLVLLARSQSYQWLDSSFTYHPPPLPNEEKDFKKDFTPFLNLNSHTCLEIYLQLEFTEI